MNKIKKLIPFIGLPLLIAWGGKIFAHGETSSGTETTNIELVTGAFLLKLSLYALAAVLILMAVAISFPRPREWLKRLLFWSIVVVVAATTIFMAAITIRLNLISWSGGPVHWHADFEVWACGQELDLLDPQGFLSNKTGTPTQHEHNDKRLHIEGVVVHEEDASLSHLFNSLGGRLTKNELHFPTNSGMVIYQNGDRCPDGSPGFVQVFVYQMSPDRYYQQQLVDPSLHKIAAQSQVPPGDCVIVEFGSLKEKTSHLCKSYKVAEEIGKLRGLRPNETVGPEGE